MKDYSSITFVFNRRSVQRTRAMPPTHTSCVWWICVPHGLPPTGTLPSVCMMVTRRQPYWRGTCPQRHWRAWGSTHNFKLRSLNAPCLLIPITLVFLPLLCPLPIVQRRIRLKVHTFPIFIVMLECFYNQVTLRLTLLLCDCGFQALPCCRSWLKRPINLWCFLKRMLEWATSWVESLHAKQTMCTTTTGALSLSTVR